MRTTGILLLCSVYGALAPASILTTVTFLLIKLTGKKFLRIVRRLLVTANVVPSSQILVTLMKEALSSSET
jgi:hypothetical protein